MENGETTPPTPGRQDRSYKPTSGRPRAHRSAVSQGTRLFAVEGIDGRTQTAMRFRDLVEAIGNDLGGSDLLSEGQKQLIRRASALSIMAEGVEADLVRNLPFDSATYLMATNALRRVLETLGIQRVAKDAGQVTLAHYLEARYAPVDAGPASATEPAPSPIEVPE